MYLGRLYVFSKFEEIPSQHRLSIGNADAKQPQTFPIETSEKTERSRNHGSWVRNYLVYKYYASQDQLTDDTAGKREKELNLPLHGERLGRATKFSTAVRWNDLQKSSTMLAYEAIC